MKSFIFEWKFKQNQNQFYCLIIVTFKLINFFDKGSPN